MNRSGLARMFKGIIVLTMLALPLLAIEDPVEVKVGDIRKGGIVRFNNVRVHVVGTVSQLAEPKGKNTDFYILKDDWGGLIKIRTSSELPIVAQRYRIVGPVGQDPVTKELYISEEQRLAIVPEKLKEVGVAERERETGMKLGTPTDQTEVAYTNTAGPGATTQAVPPSSTTTTVVPPSTETVAYEPPASTEPEKKGLSNTILGIIIALAILVIVIIGVAIKMLTGGGEKSASGDFTRAATAPIEPPPPPEQVIEGRTIKMHAPPPNTVKLMPGYFEVVAGDETVKQIRFYKMKGETACETTFGRSTGRPYVHIQLKPMTVSTRQAKVTFDAVGTPKLTNLAALSSNPTRVNGRELNIDEAVTLQEGDKVEMGEIVFKFHAA